MDGREYKCEVEEYLTDKEDKRWIKLRTEADPYRSRLMQVHHIWGRQGCAELFWSCSLIQIREACHAFLHDMNPNKVEVACLYSKMKQESHRRSLFRGVIDGIRPDTWFWNLPAMNKACGHPSLAHRVEYLRQKVLGTVYELQAIEILKFIKEEEGCSSET